MTRGQEVDQAYSLEFRPQIAIDMQLFLSIILLLLALLTASSSWSSTGLRLMHFQSRP